MLVATFLCSLLVDYCCASNFSSSAIFSISFYFYGRRWNFILGLFLENINPHSILFHTTKCWTFLNILFGFQLSLQISMTQATLKKFSFGFYGRYANKIPRYLCLKNLKIHSIIKDTNIRRMSSNCVIKKAIFYERK